MAKRYDIPIEMRFSDLDIYGHVNGVVYFDYLEAARVRLLSEQFRELTDSGIQLLVARAECDYRIPILYNDTVVVSVTIARIGETSFDLEYCIHDRAGKSYATAKTIMVCYDSVRKATTTVPQAIREMA